MTLPASESEGWKTIDNTDMPVQVRKVSDGLFMLRQGTEGTAVAVTEQQLAQYVQRLHNKRQN